MVANVLLHVQNVISSYVRLAVAGGWWLVLICYERTILLTGW